jgi:hypothetical protein
VTAILTLITLALNLAVLAIVFATARQLRRVDADLTKLEKATFELEGKLAWLEGRRP